MKLEFVKPFVDSTMTVLRKILNTEIRQGEIKLLRTPELTGDISLVIGIQDESGESIILNTDARTAMGICGAMNGTPFEAMNELGFDTLGEVANMIAGNAVTILNERGFDFTVRVPFAVSGEDIPGITGGLELFQVPVLSEYGEVTVNFMMRTN